MNQPRPHPALLTRRRFLGQASCAAVSAIPVINTLLNLKLAGSVAAAEPGAGEYRALVCLFLNGGNDSFNMLVPRGAAEYADYAAIRQDLALAQGELLAINPLDHPGPQLGVHPAMPELQQLFEDGHAAFVANVGTLVEPVTKAHYLGGSAPLPLGLFSHSDQVEQWQTSLPDTRSAVGWAGRMADLLQSVNANTKVSMNISLAGSNVWQSGQSVFEYAITPDGAVGLQGYAPAWQQYQDVIQSRSAAVDGQLGLHYQNLFAQAFASSKRDAVNAYEVFAAATAPDLPPGAVFPATTLGRSLRMIARTIAGRDALGMTRQTFFVNFGGWDHHDEVLNNQAAMLPVVSQAVGAFYQALDLLGVANQVTLFSASDFGRTLTSNGRGSDHAWGGNQFVVGGGVNGRRIYGHYPDLYEDNALDVGRGRLIPTTSTDAFFAELALWLGVSRTNLPLVLPNITRFFDPNGTAWPLGFLA
ncbi:MAG TPA: DUF1501 domain-containing protein [Kiritimatiellia bacterium]|nr:DUF1501 domain-containing protein [Kiritimatiellia bacterium]HMP34722.1 DUF1501 domain-containing protein [Kiritimatiellia bacterium]